MISRKLVIGFSIVFCLQLSVCLAQELRTGTYPDGSVRYKGYFLNNEPVGEMLRYYPDGKLQAKMEYKGDTVKALLYSKDGAYTSSGMYVNKLKDGVWKYRKGEHLLIQESYRNNILEGARVVYFTSGKTAESQVWDKGKPEGEWSQYYKDGQLRLQSSYKVGKLNGLVRRYGPEGNLRATGEYRNDRKEGKWLFYDEQGKLLKEKVYHKGIAEGALEEEMEESRRLDELVRSGTKIPDPAVFADDPESYMRLTGME